MNDDDFSLVAKAVAFAAIRKDYDDSPMEGVVGRFISHHREIFDREEWEGASIPYPPTSVDVLAAIECREIWEDAEAYMCDFSLPADLTNYVICVRIGRGGDVESVDMES